MTLTAVDIVYHDFDHGWHCITKLRMRSTFHIPTSIEVRYSIPRLWHAVSIIFLNFDRGWNCILVLRPRSTLHTRLRLRLTLHTTTLIAADIAYHDLDRCWPYIYTFCTPKLTAINITYPNFDCDRHFIHQLQPWLTFYTLITTAVNIA